jgi:hypothetical protein
LLLQVVVEGALDGTLVVVGREDSVLEHPLVFLLELNTPSP